MKNITLCSSILLCLGSMPLLSLKGEDEDTADNPKPVAAAASLNASQATTPAVAKAAPRKVPSRPEPFVLNAEACTIMQSTAPQNAEEKETLLEKAARAVELEISVYGIWPHDTTKLMASFTNVRSLSIKDVDFDELPLLPCPEKLESLALLRSPFQTIQNITHYTNLHTLRLIKTSLRITVPNLNEKDRLSVLTQLHNLRTLDCGAFLLLNHRAPKERDLFIQILDSNPDIEKLTCAGAVDTDAVQALANLPLRQLSLMDGKINNAKLALLPFDTLEELELHGEHTLTDLTPLQGSHLRVLHLPCQENLDDTMLQVICAMPKLEELKLINCRLTDTQAESLFPLAPRLHRLKILSSNPRLSAEMHRRLKAAFGDKVSVNEIVY